MARRRTRRSKETSTENQNIRPVVEKGMIGGRFKPLTDHDLEQIHQTVLDVLENIGMANPLPELKEIALENGCTFTDKGRLLFPRSLVEDVIARAGRDFVMYGRDPKHDVDMSDKKVNLYGGGEAVTMLDLGAKKYRPSTINDVYDIARLVDYLENVHSYSRVVVATEFTDLLKTDIGEFELYEGKEVPLDVPLFEDDDVELQNQKSLEKDYENSFPESNNDV